jgi:hypothetical protein
MRLRTSPVVRRLAIALAIGLVAGGAVAMIASSVAGGTCTSSGPPPGGSTCEDLVRSLSLRVGVALGISTSFVVLIAQGLLATADRVEEQRRERAAERGTGSR